MVPSVRRCYPDDTHCLIISVTTITITDHYCNAGQYVKVLVYNTLPEEHVTALGGGGGGGGGGWSAYMSL